MGSHVTLAFFRKDYFSYQEAKERKEVYSVRLDYGEPHKGMNQTAVYDAIEIIGETRRCFGIESGSLNYVLLDDENNLIDAG